MGSNPALKQRPQAGKPARMQARPAQQGKPRRQTATGRYTPADVVQCSVRHLHHKRLVPAVGALPFRAWSNQREATGRVVRRTWEPLCARCWWLYASAPVGVNRWLDYELLAGIKPDLIPPGLHARWAALLARRVAHGK